MAEGYAKQIQDRIHKAPESSVFVNSDFADIANTDTVRRTLNRLAQKDTLRRVFNGVYENQSTVNYWMSMSQSILTLWLKP